ncbi:hypothetical protein KUCAC02_019070 [Chaenocephalus aceratus]|uniref:Uncharacterized protein n=1 Tax=Chaenocephalus aceratus TaxID=36190 RepID=A0ACB9WBS8_CHAAC|nr:hypothetical protein KUCAC02_019070 [Chaenocephalus aceratus]
MEEFPVKVSEAVCLGASLALSGICYCLYKKSRTTLDNSKLVDAPHFTIDGKLKDILKVTPGACLQYAVIEGAVQPVGEPLTSSFQKEIFGVLQKVLLREHRLVWNSLSRTWTDSERVLHQRVTAVPFVVVGSDDTAVRVLCPLQASGVHMETTHEKFHQVNYGFSDIIGQYLSGEKLKGQLETEEMLKVGATLTGESTAGWWKGLAIASAVAGAGVLLWLGRRYYNKLKVHWQREKERREFDRLRAENPRARAPVAGHEAIENEEEEHLVKRLCDLPYSATQSISRVVPLYHV